MEHSAQTDCHIGVTAEIKVQLKTVSQNDNNSRDTVQGKGLCKAIVGHQAKGVRQQHFFGKSQNKEIKSPGKGKGVKFTPGIVLKLGNHFLIEDDRPCNQLRKKGNKGQIVEKAVMFTSAKRPVDDEGQLLECKETDAQGQQDMFQIKIRMKSHVYIFDKEIIVFKVK